MTYRVDLNPEAQRAVEAAAARQGVSVETYIANAATINAFAGAAEGVDGATKAERNMAQRARIAAARGKFAHVPGTVDDFLQERHAEAVREMAKDSA